MTTKDTTVSVPATASKGWERGSAWVVDVPGTPVRGAGASLAAARQEAGHGLATLAANVTELPALVRDGDGSLWIFTAHPDGYRGMRLRADDTTAGCSMVGAGTPAAAADMLARNHDGAVRLA
jgi:hypothetical protein